MDSNIKCKRWPAIITFSLGVLGYFRLRKDVYARCLPCLFKLKEDSEMQDLFYLESDTTKETTSVVQGDRLCSVCEDLNTNVTARKSSKELSRGPTSSETSEDVPLLNDNHEQIQYRSIEIVNSGGKVGGNSRCRLLNALSLLWLLLVICLIVYDWFSRLWLSWGNKTHLLHLLSYSTYLLPLIVVAMMRVISMFYESTPSTQHGWVYTLTTEHVLTRLKILDMSKVRRFGYLCISFAVTCVGFQLSYDIYEIVMRCSTIDVFTMISLVGCFFGEFMFVSLCYVIYLLKRCIRANFTSCLYFLKQNIENVDSCRQRIMEAYSDFLRLHNLISLWLVFQFSLSIFKASCQIYWNYWVFSQNRAVLSALLINIMIWLEIAMFLILPPLAVGGFDIVYLWEDFKLNVTRVRREKQDDKWYPIVKLVKTLKPLHVSLFMTVFFSVLGIFSALHLSGQYAEYWHEDSVCSNYTVSG
ncbi:uncharacterized protein LOC144452037 [Glandiceps talaboti]